MFDEITASSLIVVNPEGYVVTADGVSEINHAGFTIHSAVHMQRPSAHSVMRTHTLAGMAVSAQAEGLLPLNQMWMKFYGRVSYHDYEGIADDLDERDRLVRHGDNDVMILKHHGLLTVRRNVAEAFRYMYYLDRLAASRPLRHKAGGKLNCRRRTSSNTRRRSMPAIALMASWARASGQRSGAGWIASALAMRLETESRRRELKPSFVVVPPRSPLPHAVCRNRRHWIAASRIANHVTAWSWLSSRMRAESRLGDVAQRFLGAKGLRAYAVASQAEQHSHQRRRD